MQKRIVLFLAYIYHEKNNEKIVPVKTLFK